MKTKKSKKASRKVIKAQPEQPKIEMTQVPVTIPVAKVNLTGLRGLRGLVFGIFKAAYEKTNDLKALPDMATVTAEVEKYFPQSRWMASPERTKVHYSYYKSKFISSLKVAAEQPKQ